MWTSLGWWRLILMLLFSCLIQQVLVLLRGILMVMSLLRRPQLLQQSYILFLQRLCTFVGFFPMLLIFVSTGSILRQIVCSYSRLEKYILEDPLGLLAIVTTWFLLLILLIYYLFIDLVSCNFLLCTLSNFIIIEEVSEQLISLVQFDVTVFEHCFWLMY